MGHVSCVRLLFFFLLAWVITTNAWAQSRAPWEDPAWLSRQIHKIDNGPFEDKAVSFWRTVIVESTKPLFKHGEQMSEQDLLGHLSRWQRDDSTVVVLDSGFMLPVLPGLYKVYMKESSRSRIAPDRKRMEDFGTGPAIRMKAANIPSGMHVEAQIEIYGFERMSLGESFAHRPVSGVTRNEGTKHASINLTWDAQLTTVTALTGTLKNARYPHCTVFLLPVSQRSALRSAADAPPLAIYSKASIQTICGVVRMKTFWALMKDIRPDIYHPEDPVSGDVLNLFWSDDKWQTFKAVMEKQGTVWSEPLTDTLTPEKAQVFAKHEGIQAVFQWRPENRMNWQVTTSTKPANEGPYSSCKSEVRLWSESYHRRWNLIVCDQGMATYVMAVRFDFE